MSGAVYLWNGTRQRDPGYFFVSVRSFVLDLDDSWEFPAVSALAVRALVLVLVLVGIGCERKDPGASDATRCGAAFVARADGRCCLAGVAACTTDSISPARVVVPATELDFGASDWEARGTVAARRVVTAAFALDAYELDARAARQPGDPQRAAAGLSRAEARALCTERGGRLPTEDEWLAAAATHRYPWGDTGLVCRRAAWGTAHGPCARGATGPDTIGAHPDGASPAGVHDLAGNVAEWVETNDGSGEVRGGSYADDFAANLRSWAARAVDPASHDPTIGARCAYSIAPDGG